MTTLVTFLRLEFQFITRRSAVSARRPHCLWALPVHLATSQGTAVRAVTSVALRVDSQMDDLHLMDNRRRGLKGEPEVLARFFAVRDVRMPKRFQAGWMTATPSLSSGTAYEEGCFFTAGPFGYRLTLASSLLSVSAVKSFCEDRANIGLGISHSQALPDGQFHRWVSCNRVVRCWAGSRFRRDPALAQAGAR